SAAAQQIGARTLANGEALVSNYQFYRSTRSYARDNPQVLNILFEEIGATGNWPRYNPGEAVAQVAPPLRPGAQVTATALLRQGYGPRPLSPEVIRAQQDIADTFYQLKLIPRELNISEVVWAPPTHTAAN